ncbi:20165_t:CDS:2, partial [Gigaspora margarita]
TNQISIDVLTDASESGSEDSDTCYEEQSNNQLITTNKTATQVNETNSSSHLQSQNNIADINYVWQTTNEQLHMMIEKVHYVSILHILQLEQDNIATKTTDLKIKIATYETENTNLRIDNIKYNSKFTALEKECTELRSKNVELKSINEGLEKENFKLKSMNTNLGAQIADSKLKIKELNQKEMDLQIQLTSLKARLNDLNDQHMAILTKNEKDEKAIKELEKELKETIFEKDKVEKRLLAIIDDRNVGIKSMNEKIAKLESEKLQLIMEQKKEKN